VTTTAPVFKANAEGRTAWLASIYGPQQDWHRANRTPAPLELVTEALDRIAEEGAKLGRTEAWKNAVAWHAATLAENPTGRIPHPLDLHAGQRLARLRGLISSGGLSIGSPPATTTTQERS
jgi:hypothetical protein